MRSAVVVLLTVAVGLDALDLGKVVLPIRVKIHENLATAYAVVGNVQSKLGGAGQKLRDGLEKVKDVLASVDTFFQTQSGGQATPGAGGQNQYSTPNQYGKRDGSVAQVAYRYAPQDDGAKQALLLAPAYSGYGKRDASSAQVAYRLVPLDGSAAQVPYLFARRFLQSARGIPYQYTSRFLRTAPTNNYY